MPACDRLRASSAGVVIAVVVEGVLVPCELPCCGVSGGAFPLPPVGVRSPALMASGAEDAVRCNKLEV